MAEPGAKKAKLSPNDSSYYFTEENIADDRVLLVGKTRLFVQSNKLMQYSEYFRVMFSSDFIEKNKETIELREFKADRIKLFLEVLFRSDDVDVNDENLAVLTELFVYFQAVDSLIEFFKTKHVFKMFPTEDFLELVDRFGLKELKSFVEESLIEQLVSKYKKKRRVPKRKQAAKDFKFDDSALNGLKLSKEYGMMKLQEKIDTHLAFDYTTYVHFPSVDAKYLKLLEQYKLVELTKVVETYALEIVPRDVNGVVKQYLSNKLQIELKDLKVAAEQILITEFERGYICRSRLSDHLYACNSYGFQELKEKIRVYLTDLYKTVDRDTSRISEGDIVHLAITYSLEPISSDKQNMLVNQFKINKSNYSQFISWLANYNLPELKEIVEEYLLNKFNVEEKENENIEEYCQYSVDCRMEKLTDVIDAYFVAQFHANHSFEHIKLALDYNMEKFKNVLGEFLKTVTYDNPILNAGREHIETLSAEHHTFILLSILRKPNVEEENTSIFS